MRPETVDLGLRLAEHLMREDSLFGAILNLKPTDEEAVFLSICIFRKGSITKAWERD